MIWLAEQVGKYERQVRGLIRKARTDGGWSLEHCDDTLISW